jgi:hypothetical protein
MIRPEMLPSAGMKRPGATTMFQTPMAMMALANASDRRLRDR